jgi:hypothetical protein
MDLRKTILQAHNASQTRKIVDYVGANAARFKALIEVFLAGPYRITQRASWPLSYCVEYHPQLIKPHFKALLDMLEQPDAHVAARRNIVRLLQFVEVPVRYRGRVATICFEMLQDRKEAVAVRVFSMTVLANLVPHEPDLAGELKVIIEDNLPYGSAGFVSRARKVLREFKVQVEDSRRV